MLDSLNSSAWTRHGEPRFLENSWGRHCSAEVLSLSSAALSGEGRESGCD